MKIRWGRFNIYFHTPAPARSRRLLAATLALAFLAAAPACRTSKPSKDEAATLRFHLQTNPDPAGHSMPAVVGRSAPFQIEVQQDPFLSEVFILEANLVDAVGGFELAIQFDRQGTWLLEQYTTANLGRRIALFSQFSDARWLAAPLIDRRIADGQFQFTPDATREEAERIVRGLQEVSRAVRKEQ